MFCRFCGERIPDDSKFCKACGKRVGVQSAAKRNAEELARGRPESAPRGIKRGPDSVRKKLERQKTLFVLALISFILAATGLGMAYFFIK